jgi:predicted nucleic acid-binding protein
MKAVIDTNILVDYLSGHPPARTELSRYRQPIVSLITWMEVLVGARETDEERILRDFLNRFEILPVDEPVAEEAVLLRRTHRIRLPDAIILATARVAGCLLVTRNTRDFPADEPGIRVPYQL